MKELSIEEKAKAYDEALKVLHKYDDAHIMFTQDLKEEMFPELREVSEDEKIRKELIRVFSNREKYVVNQSFGDINVSDILAWLEKQGEKPVNKVKPKFRIGDVIEVKPLKCHGKIFTGKPNKIVDITEESYILDDGKAYSIELQDGWKLSEKKPTKWSKEDEDMLDDLICYFDKSCGLRHLFFEVATWLKSLKARVQPQQKQSTIKFDEPDIEEMVEDYWYNKDVIISSHTRGIVEEAYRQGLEDMWKKLKK